MPRITVVIPLYNKEKEIERTISTILAQTITDYEIIVVDDGSTDNGPALVEKIVDKRIRIIYKENGGASTARNAGIENASSELIAFLDADDEWDPQHLEILLRLRRKYPEAGLYTTAYKIIFENGKNHIPSFVGINPRPWEGIIENYFISLIKGTPPVWTSAVAIPKVIFSDVGLFDIEMRRSQDSQMWARVAANYPVAFSWDGPAFHRRDASNRMMKVKNQLITSNPEKYIQKIIIDPLMAKNGNRKSIHAYNNYTLFQCIKYSLIGNGNWNSARRYLSQIKVSLSVFPQYVYWFILSYIFYKQLPLIRKIKHRIFS